MEHFSRPEGTLKNLLEEFTALERLAVEIGKRGDKQFDTWLEDVKNREGDINEIKKEATEITEVPHLNDPNRRVNLNMKLIHTVKAVKILKEIAVEVFLGGIPEEKLQRFSEDDLISSTSRPPHEIGSGGFGKVYKGQLASGVQVAIKILERKAVVEEIFMSEISTMLKASHPNIIQLYGFCSNAEMKALVYEFMEKGSLDVPYSVEWEVMYGIAIYIAKALAYLHHGCGNQIIHHDVKPSNVLLDSNHFPKVTDFGTTRIMNMGMSHFTATHLIGTRGYIAPEIGMYLERVTYKCDVFSFGKVLFDILGMRNSTEIRHSLPNQVWENYNKGELGVTIKECGFEKKDIKRARLLSMVGLWCIQHTPERRPSMNDVVSALEEKIEIHKPPNPFLVCNGDFSMPQLLSPSTSESNSQPSHFIRGVEAPSRLQENLKKLLKEVDMLKRIRDVRVHKEGRQIASWLEAVKVKVDEAEELEKEYGVSKNGPLIIKHKLNSKVIDLLRSVKVLREDGNAISDLIETFLTDITGEKPKRFTLANIDSFTSRFSNPIDSHYYGNVYKGCFPTGMHIVVKKLEEKDFVEEIFMAEMRIMFKMSHRNVIKLYGFCFERNMKALVFEYAPNGSLDKVLFDDHEMKIEWEKLYSIATETAKGLLYLHDGLEDPLLHCDLKSRNVLLDSNMCPKISNFGASKFMRWDRTHQTVSRVRGDPPYSAPEMMYSLIITPKCDVYSFGMILFEVLGRRRNIRGCVFFPREVWKKFANREIEEIMKECGIAEKNREKAMLLCMVAFWCIQYTPENRPTISTVVKMLEKEIKVAVPPDPFVPSEAHSVKPFVEVVYDF